MEKRNLSVLSVISQSVPSRISVVMVEETEVREAERLPSIPVDTAVRLLAGRRVLRCDCFEDCIVMSGAIGTLSCLTLLLLALWPCWDAAPV